MKNITMSIVALLAMNTLAFAGGDISPVEPEVNVPEVESTPGSFYAGLGYSYMNLDAGTDHDGDAILLLAGYNFNQYIGVEARYAGLTDCLDNAAIYVKPMYPFGAATVYGLLGYGETTMDNGTVDNSGDGFQWGLGANYAITENIGVFADYTNLYDDSEFDGRINTDVTVDSINVGVTYTF